MSRPLSPGQTVPLEFSLADAPDEGWPVIAQVRQSTAAGGYTDVTATVSPAVTNPDTLDYVAWFTVPEDAVHGTAFRVKLSVVIDGEEMTPLAWLDGGTVDTRSAAIKAKTDTIRNGGVTIVNAVSATGRITIRQGFDYSTSGGAQLTIEESEVGDWPADKLAANSFGFHVRHTGMDDFIDVDATLNAADGDGLRSITVELTREEIPSRIGQYDWQVYCRFDAADDEPVLLEGTMQVKRGRKITAA